MTNTDSRELDDIILQVAYEAGLIPRGKTISADSFLEAKQALLAYTANKQRQLLEWVEQELVIKVDQLKVQDGQLLHVIGAELLTHEVHQIVKNKKESL